MSMYRRLHESLRKNKHYFVRALLLILLAYSVAGVVDLIKNLTLPNTWHEWEYWLMPGIPVGLALGCQYWERHKTKRWLKAQPNLHLPNELTLEEAMSLPLNELEELLSGEATIDLQEKEGHEQFLRDHGARVPAKWPHPLLTGPGTN